MVKAHRLILLHAPSGVGKSSLLRAGLLRDVRARGGVVYFNDTWGGKGGDDPLDDEWLDRWLARSLRLKEQWLHFKPFQQLNIAFGARAVLVLDQCEELIRYSPLVAQRVFALIVRLNREYPFRIVVSFRSEQLHDFEYLEAEAVPFSVTSYKLPELTDAGTAMEIVRSGAPDIDQTVAKVLAWSWAEGRVASLQDVEVDGPRQRIGLLHLQAMLYVLYFRIGRLAFSADTIRSLFETTAEGPSWILPGPHSEPSGDDHDPGSGEDDRPPRYLLTADAFRWALQESVTLKLTHCRAAADKVDDIDDGLLEGTSWALERSVAHLASSGYKVLRSTRELIELAMGSDHEALHDGLRHGHNPTTDSQEAALLKTVRSLASGTAKGLDLLTATRATLTQKAQNVDAATDGEPADGWTERIGADWRGTVESDPRRVTCGSLMGHTPADALIEEYRRFAFALEWMQESSLVRITDPMETGEVVSLIHDGFGYALQRWARGRLNTPNGPLNAVTAPRGASFAWNDGPARIDVERMSAVAGHPHAREVLPNLRWRGGWVQADLKWVTLVNCDFRGTMFDGCRMEGVTFVNCLLDGAIFSDCLFMGSQEDLDGACWSEDQPEFLVPANKDLVEAHARQRGLDMGLLPMNGERAFLSRVAGSPAIPLTTEDLGGSTKLRPPGPKSNPFKPGRLTLEPVKGGVAVYGGRISSLVVRGCWLESGGGLTLRHTTGSGLEVVELPASTGRLEIYGSAVRHVSFSRQHDGDVQSSLSVRVRESVLAQVWAGAGLEGKADVQGCQILHAWNESPETFSFAVKHSTVHGSVGVTVEVEDGSVLPAVHPPLADLETPFQRMDYRRDPWRFIDRQAGSDAS